MQAPGEKLSRNSCRSKEEEPKKQSCTNTLSWYGIKRPDRDGTVRGGDGDQRGKVSCIHARTQRTSPKMPAAHKWGPGP